MSQARDSHLIAIEQGFREHGFQAQQAGGFMTKECRKRLKCG